MATEAPSWADQWGAGGIGAMEEEDTANKKDAGNTKKGESKTGLTKAKAAAQKIKSGASNSFKWVKSKCQKKDTDTK